MGDEEIKIKLNHLEQCLTGSINMLMDEEVLHVLKESSMEHLIPMLQELREACYEKSNK